jgi:hypothetical protein
MMPVLLSAAVLVGGVNLAAYAANGHPLLLGHRNHETKTATVSNSGKGAALSLKTRRSSPPLKVNSSKRVKHLNADALDGASAAALRTTSYLLTDSDTTTSHPALTTWSLSKIPAGRYLVSWDVNLVPPASGISTVCGITTTTYSRQFAASEETFPGSWIAQWLSGSTVMKFDPTQEMFFCQTHGTSIQLANPLTISFTKVDSVKNQTASVSRAAKVSARDGVGR